MINGHTTSIFVENNINDYFQKKIPKANTYVFLTKNWFYQKSKNVIYAKETYVGEEYVPLVDDQWPHNPHFCRK
jgi:hypothetical protein